MIAITSIFTLMDNDTCRRIELCWWYDDENRCRMNYHIIIIRNDWDIVDDNNYDDDRIHILEISDTILILSIVMTILYDDDGDIKSYFNISMTCVFTSSYTFIHHHSNLFLTIIINIIILVIIIIIILVVLLIIIIGWIHTSHKGQL
jgi:hypothetical protein